MRVGVPIVRVPEERDAQNKNAESQTILRILLPENTPRAGACARGEGEEARGMHLESERRGTRREGEAHREER